MHPKVKAGASTAGAITVIVIALFGVFGVDLDSKLSEALGLVLAAVLPVLAGWLKKA